MTDSAGALDYRTLDFRIANRRRTDGTPACCRAAPLPDTKSPGVSGPCALQGAEAGLRIVPDASPERAQLPGRRTQRPRPGLRRDRQPVQGGPLGKESGVIQEYAESSPASSPSTRRFRGACGRRSKITARSRRGRSRRRPAGGRAPRRGEFRRSSGHEGAPWSLAFLVPLFSLAIEIACAGALVSYLRAMAGEPRTPPA